MLQEHTFNVFIGVAMPWLTHVLYFVLTATLTSIKHCNGRTADAGAVLQSRTESISAHSPRFGTAQGSLHVRSVLSDVEHESAVPTRDGSLAFKVDNRKPNTVLHSSVDAKLKRMDASVQCGDNLMTLKVKQGRAPHILVDSGEGTLIPLSQMPSSCGFSVKRSRRDVLFAAPYQGCHVTQQGGNYVLPLRLWGVPMTMSCPAVSQPPYVSCFSSGMVIKIGGITANELKVKVSGTWKSLSSVSSSCGFSTEMLSGGLTLIAPYHRGLCIEIKDEEYLLSLLLADVEVLATCPSLPRIKTTTATTIPSSDGGQFPQHTPNPQFPIFPQYPVVPGPSLQSQSPTAPTYASAPQHPRLPSGAAVDFGPGTKNQEVPAAQQPAFPFTSQYSQFPQYPLFPVPTQSTANKNTAAPQAQLPQMPQSPQHPFLPHGTMVPGIVPGISQTTSPRPPAMSKEVLVTTPAPNEHDGKPHFPQQPYHFLPFPKHPVPPENQPQAVQDPKPVLQQPKPHAFTQYPQSPFFPQYPGFPGPSLQSQSPTAPTDASAPQHLRLPSGAAVDFSSGTKNQQVPSAQHPAFPFTSQYSQFPQYSLFPSPVPPTQSTANKNTAAPQAQLPHMPQSPQHPFPPHGTMVPGIFQPTSLPHPATSTDVLVTIPAPTKHDGKPHFPQQPYHFLPFPKHPVPPENQPQAVQDPKPVLQQPKPHVFTQYPQFPNFPQYPVFPGPSLQSQSPTAPTDASAQQHLRLPSGAAVDLSSGTKNQQVPSAQHPAFPFTSQYSQFPQYSLSPSPVPPTQSTANKNTAAPQAQLPHMPQSPQHPFPPHGTMVPGIFQPTSLPHSATSTDVLVTIPAPTEHDGKPHFPQQPYHFLPFPGPYLQSQSPTAPTDASAQQHPRLPSGAAEIFGPGTKNQEVPAAQQPAFPFTSQYSQFPQYPLFPVPTQSTANKNTAAPQAQLPQMPQSALNPFLFPPQFPLVPGIFQQTTPPPPATSTEVLVTIPAPIEHDRKSHFPQQPYPFLPFPKHPVPPENQHQAVHLKPVIQQPKPHVYPQTYQIPVLYPPQRQNTYYQTAASATTTGTTALKPAVQKPFYYPQHYMPQYYVPQQPPVPVFPGHTKNYFS